MMEVKSKAVINPIVKLTERCEDIGERINEAEIIFADKF
jgi:hypothetical protein